MLWAASARGGEWKLVWSDEFDKPGLPDKTKWGYEEGLVRNHEAQYYTKDRLENARVKNGMLVLEGRKVVFAHSNGERWTGYTSASLTTEGKASWTYGRIEVRAKLPKGRGVWPSIWLLGENMRSTGWPRCGEIDIMEFVGKAPGAIHATVHYSMDGKHASNSGACPLPNPKSAFHNYAMEWWPDRIDFFFDDKKYYTVPVEKAQAGFENPFHKPQYLILNLALGGSWGGPIDNAALPQKFMIEYVRVYQQPPEQKAG
jgi:beta-glucanase (GH16 family)